jgi:hypothetical protein
MTNPPNERSRRKFISGHIFEWIVSLILTRIGILKQKQLKGDVELPNLLRVSGKCDFVAGGAVDWEKSFNEIEKLKVLMSQSFDDAPPFILHAGEYIYEHFKHRFEKNPLKEVVYECKSISSVMFNKVERVGAMPNHILQTGHYLLANKMDEGKIGYISKDDCLMSEFSVDNSRELMMAYKIDVATMTGWYNNAGKNYLNNKPPLEPEVYFDHKLFKFEKNYRVEYSNYLQMLYGYETPEQYRDKWAKSVASWNRVFKRCVCGDKMTDNNKAVINEAIKVFPEWDDYVMMAKEVGAFLTEETEEV